ncbi:MAG: AraC family transcriptional regulator [Terrimicrobiaceae bacterium]|nr:AraC family transcriptional regulator [Terrimicrobiaceae bacterium]
MQNNDFPAIALDPCFPFDRIRELYLYEEPALLASIRRGDRKEATRIINLLLVHIYSAGAERSELLKGLLLELIVMMSRAAVEAGASQTEVLGLRFQHLTELAGIGDDEHLARWLRESVVRIFETVERHQNTALPSVVVRALKIIREQSAGPLTRARVARKAGISPSHLADLLQERTGRSFTELVRAARVDRACGLLRSTELSLADIAAECGFCDQSYFTRVFQKLRKEAPKQYRDNFLRTPKTQKNPP